MSDHDSASGHHIVSTTTYFIIFWLLMLLLVATVAVAYFDWGWVNLPLALAIAVTKAVLIVLFFMHIKYAVPLTQVIAGSGFLWLMFLFLFTLSDYVTRTMSPLNAADDPAYQIEMMSADEYAEDPKDANED